MSSGNVITKIYAEMHQVRGKQERQLPDEQVTRRRQVPGEQEWLSDYALADEKPGKEAVDYPIRPTKARRMRQLQNALVSPKPISQTDCYKPFYMQILQFGLNYAYHMQTQPSGDNDHFKYTKTKKPKHIIVVGAGMSGLSAAYELAQVGHKVTIIEKQSRVGGRVKTLSEPHFSKGLWSDCELNSIDFNSQLHAFCLIILIYNKTIGHPKIYIFGYILLRQEIAEHVCENKS